MRQPAAITAAEHPLLAGLSAAQYEAVTAYLEPRHYARGEVIVHKGDAAAGLFLVLRGEVTSRAVAADGGRHRITTLSPGMSFGEMPLLMTVPFLLDMVADTPVDLVVVSVPHFEALTADAPGVKLALLENLATGAYGQMAAVIRTLGRFDIGL